MKKFNTEMEVRVVVLLAQGHTYSQVDEIFRKEFGRPIDDKLIAAVKKRNLPNLEMIKERLLAREEADALAIKQRANKMIVNRLKDDESQDSVLDKARREYVEGKIPLKEYTKIIRAHRRITINELVGVSREMHTQSDGGSPDTPDKKDLAALVEAIRSGNEIKVNQIIFNEGAIPDDLTSGTTPQPVQDL